MSLVETLKQKEAARKSDAERRHREAISKAVTFDSYRDLLVAEAGTPGDGDADAAAGLMASLGLSADDVAADLAAVARVRRLTPLTDPERLAETTRESAAAIAAVIQEQRSFLVNLFTNMDHERLPTVVEEMAKAKMLPGDLTGGWYERLRAAYGNANGAARMKLDAEAELARLRQQHPRLFSEAVAG